MTQPGILMRLVQTDKSLDSSITAPSGICSGVEAIYRLGSADELQPALNTVYFLSDITPIVSSSVAYDQDVKSYASSGITISWIVCAFINGRDAKSESTAAYTKPHVPSTTPAAGSIVIANGSTPRPDKEQDYHNWYDQEHGEKLRLVPGWNAARRYSLAKSYGEVETANFYGINFYDEKNGLGGPEWKAGVTEWTLRIRDNAAKPNIRRQWRFLSAQ